MTVPNGRRASFVSGLRRAHRCSGLQPDRQPAQNFRGPVLEAQSLREIALLIRPDDVGRRGMSIALYQQGWPHHGR